MRGVLISIEGLDSSGKTTQIGLLKERLEAEGKKIAVFKFPSYEKTYYGKLIKRYLDGEFGNVEAVSPYLIGVIYALDRLEMRDAIIKELESGSVALLDRYVASNKAYMAAKLPQKERDKFLHWLDELDFKKHAMPREDKVLFLDVPVSVTRELMQGKKRDIHEQNSAYLEEVWKIYLELAKQERWEVIPCVRQNKILTRGAIAEQIFKKVEPLL
ncbi:deoxynucleoside kinase [Candidatus Woesearchaeota archaeon]|nr:deoxynucleoside kinase [Candidatus Woesearchaeota archaeon]